MSIKKKKVLHIITHFDLGGAERVALNICKSRNPNFEYHLVEVVRGKGFFSKAFIHETEKNGITYHRAPLFCFTNKLGIIFFPVWFTALVFWLKPNVIHTHTEVPDLSVWTWYSIIGRFFKKIKFVRTIHNTELWNSWRRIGRRIEPFFIQNHANISISQATSVSYKSIYLYDSPVIYNGVEIIKQEKFDGIIKDKINILFAGRLEHQKGINTLITIIKQLKEDANVVFHIVGNGSLKSNLIEQTKDKGNVFYYEKIYNLATKLSSFDFIFMPSEFEGLGLLSVEGALAHCPVILNSCPGLNETVPSDWPLKVYNNDIETYLNLLKNLHTLNREELADIAFNYAIKKFSIVQMQQQYEQVYEK